MTLTLTVYYKCDIENIFWTEKETIIHILLWSTNLIISTTDVPREFINLTECHRQSCSSTLAASWNPWHKVQVSSESIHSTTPAHTAQLRQPGAAPVVQGVKTRNDCATIQTSELISNN